jgi:uncharacterized protein (DUF1697 family)
MYCAFIKQVRVHNKNIKTTEFCRIFEEIKDVSNITPVINTGNIIFTSNKQREYLSNIITKRLSDNFDYKMDVFLKNFNEVKNILHKLPFKNTPDKFTCTLLCNDGYEKELEKEFHETVTEGSQKGMTDIGVFYWQLDKSITDSPFHKKINSTKIKCNFTNRTIGTMNKVYNKMYSLQQ